jgi:hypothetical protein
MHPQSEYENRPKALWQFFGVVCACLLALALHASPQTAQKSSAAPAGKQKVFDTAKQAADALIQAAENYDLPALKEIFGPDGGSFLVTEDPVQDKNSSIAFAAKAREKNTIVPDSKNPNLAILTVGNEDWPLPVPIVKKGGKWHFDSKAGEQELLNRRIGSNELDAIQICYGYVEAQNEYALQKREGYDVNQYAQRIISTPGKQDGLAWKNADGTWGGPVGEAIARAIEQGYKDRSQPFHGYFFKVLKGQGPAAPLGEMDFVVEGVMIGGFALAAAPAQYRVTGVKTFIVSYDGVVYEKDFGPTTLDEFKKMERFNPDKTWQPVKEQ